jgi:glycolate oxidase iron-sulfur subunit
MAGSPRSPLAQLDFRVIQQCMHCGMCLPACPTYAATKLERSSPRGRIALMRTVAEGRLDPGAAFADEMYFCLGCLACQTACPAGVDYAHLFETARAEAEQSTVLTANPSRKWMRQILLNVLFARPWLLRLLGRSLFLYQTLGLQEWFRQSGLASLLPPTLRHLEPQTPTARAAFSSDLIGEVERPRSGPVRYRVALLTGCVQDIIFSEVNRDTADVLLACGCEVVTPLGQGCCGSLHAHNGELGSARDVARQLLDLISPDDFDAIITNAAGCGSHLKHFDRLLEDDPHYAARAQAFSAKVKDVHEWLAAHGPLPLPPTQPPRIVTYDDPCHLCHGQGISRQPRELLRAIPGLTLRELPEASWCCGSAGVYSITQPEMSQKLLRRKIDCILTTGAGLVLTANPGCQLQLINGIRQQGLKIRVAHTMSVLAEALKFR